MEKQNFAEAKNESKIQGLIDDLLHRFHTCNAQQASVLKLKEKVETLDGGNPYFHEMLNDFRENGKMMWRLGIVILGSLFDYLLLFNAVAILCASTSLPYWLRYVIPPAFIVAEICIAYFTHLHKLGATRRSSKKNTLMPYFLLFIIVGMSALVILYSLANYRAADNGDSLLMYALGTIVGQVLCLVGSILYHIALITHAADIAEMFSYFRYRSVRKSLSDKIDKIEHANQNRHWLDFVLDVRNLVESMESFKRTYPNSIVNFYGTIPGDLATAMNKVMGRPAVRISSYEVTA